MGLLDLFKKKKDISPVPTLKDGTPKTFDYFAFKLHGVSYHQDILSSMPKGLSESPKDISVKLEDDTLKVYYKNKYIGSGDTQAKNKFINHQNAIVHSCSVYGGDDNKYYGCKIRMKYFY